MRKSGYRAHRNSRLENHRSRALSIAFTKRHAPRNFYKSQQTNEREKEIVSCKRLQPRTKTYPMSYLCKVAPKERFPVWH
jgi:hypothetical protein